VFHPESPLISGHLTSFAAGEKTSFILFVFPKNEGKYDIQNLD